MPQTIDSKFEHCKHKKIETNIITQERIITCNSPYPYCEYIGSVTLWKGILRKTCSYSCKR